MVLLLITGNMVTYAIHTDTHTHTQKYETVSFKLAYESMA